jgi:hypothetical protein
LGVYKIYTDFIPIKRFSGELLISQVKYPYRYTLTNKEFIFQKPNMTYHVLLADVIGMIPYTSPSTEPLDSNMNYYKIRTKVIHVINRSGTYEKEDADLILPLHPRMVQLLVDIVDFISF